MSEQRAAPPTQPKVRTRHGGRFIGWVGVTQHGILSTTHRYTHTHIRSMHAHTEYLDLYMGHVLISNKEERMTVNMLTRTHSQKQIKTKSSSREQGVFAEITFKERVMHNTIAAQGNIKGPLRVSHPRVSKSLGLYLIKIVSA